jgi:ribosomal protein S18 acetylase RimI-like enzyme
MLKLLVFGNVESDLDLEKIVKLSAENLLFSDISSDYENLGDYKSNMFLAVDVLAYGGVRPVGFSNGFISFDELGNKNFNLSSLYVNYDYRDLGVGSELLHTVYVRALNSNCDNVVFLDNNRFLQNKGFSFDFNLGKFKRGVYSNLLEHKLE